MYDRKGEDVLAALLEIASTESSISLPTSSRRILAAKRAMGVLLGLEVGEQSNRYGTLSSSSGGKNMAAELLLDADEESAFQRSLHVAALQIGCMKENDGNENNGFGDSRVSILSAETLLKRTSMSKAEIVDRFFDAASRLQQRKLVEVYDYNDTGEGQIFKQSSNYNSTSVSHFTTSRKVVRLLLCLSKRLHPTLHRKRVENYIGCIEGNSVDESFRFGEKRLSSPLLHLYDANLRNIAVSRAGSELLQGSENISNEDFLFDGYQHIQPLPFQLHVPGELSVPLLSQHLWPQKEMLQDNVKHTTDNVETKPQNLEQASGSKRALIAKSWMSLNPEQERRWCHDAYTWSGNCMSPRNVSNIEQSVYEWPKKFVLHILALLQGFDGAVGDSLHGTRHDLLSYIRSSMTSRKNIESTVARLLSGSMGHTGQGLGLAIQSILRSNDTSVQRLLNEMQSSSEHHLSPMRLIICHQEIRNHLELFAELPIHKVCTPGDFMREMLNHLYEKLSDIKESIDPVYRFLFRGACRPLIKNIFKWIFESKIGDSSMEFMLKEWPLKECHGNKTIKSWEDDEYSFQSDRRPDGPRFLDHCLHELFWCGKQCRILSELQHTREAMIRIAERSIKRLDEAVGNVKLKATEVGEMKQSEKLLHNIYKSQHFTKCNVQMNDSNDLENVRLLHFNIDALTRTSEFLCNVADDNDSEIHNLITSITNSYEQLVSNARELELFKREESLKKRRERNETVVKLMADEIESSASKIRGMKISIARKKWRRAVDAIIAESKKKKLNTHSIGTHSLIPPFAANENKNEIIDVKTSRTTEIASQLNRQIDSDNMEYEITSRSRAEWQTPTDPFPAAGLPSASTAKHIIPVNFDIDDAVYKGTAKPEELTPAVGRRLFTSKTDEDGTMTESAKHDSYQSIGEMKDIVPSSQTVPVSVVVETCIVAVIRRQYRLTSNALLALLHGPAYNVQKELEALKNYFCLGIVAFGDSLLEEIVPNLPTISMLNRGIQRGQGDANRLLQIILGNAIKDSQRDADQCSSRLSLKWSNNRGAIQHPLEIWNSVLLGYDLEWPLTLVFNKFTLARYTRIFQYLMKLRHVNSLLIGASLDIDHTTKTFLSGDLKVQGKKTNIEETEREVRHRIWKLRLLRMEASQFVSVLQQHASTELLGDAGQLCDSLRRSVNDIGQLAAAHQYHVEVASRRGCLLGKEQQRLRVVLEEALQALVTLLEFLKNNGLENVCSSDEKWSDLIQTKTSFLRRLKYLCRVLKALEGHGQLYSLFLKLDYNHYFSKKFEL